MTAGVVIKWRSNQLAQHTVLLPGAGRVSRLIVTWSWEGAACHCVKNQRHLQPSTFEDKVAPEERPSCENPPLCCKCSHNHITLPQARAGKAFSLPSLLQKEGMVLEEGATPPRARLLLLPRAVKTLGVGFKSLLDG
jgi:hypothetical protein